MYSRKLVKNKSYYKKLNRGKRYNTKKLKYRGGKETNTSTNQNVPKENLNIFQKLGKNIQENENIKKIAHVTNVSKKAFGIIANAAGPNKKPKLNHLKNK